MKPIAFVFFIALLACTYACGNPAANLQDGANLTDFDPKAEAAQNCTVTQNDDGSATISCPDGTSATVEGVKGDQGESGVDGTDGKDGSSCSVVDNGNGTYTMTCTNGTDVTWSSEGSGGANPYIPDGILQGSYVVNNSLDVAFLSGVTTITGALVINTDGMKSVMLPSLATTGGRVSVLSNLKLEELVVPLVFVGGDVHIESNPLMTTFAAPVTAIGGGLTVRLNTILDSVVLDAESIGGTATFSQNPNLSTIIMPVEEIGGDVVLGGASLLAVELPVRLIKGSLRTDWSAAIESLRFPQLRRVEGDVSIFGYYLADLELPLEYSGGDLEFYAIPVTILTLQARYVGGRLAVADTPALTAFSAPVTFAGAGVNISANDSLESLDLALDYVGGGEEIDDLSIRQNPLLSSIQLPVTKVTQRIVLAHNSAMTTAAFPNATEIGGLIVGANDTLASLQLPELITVTEAYPHEDSSSIEIGKPSSNSSNSLDGDNPSLTTFSFDKLVSVHRRIHINGNSSLTTFSMSSLIEVPTLAIGDHYGTGLGNDAMTSFSLPNLVTAPTLSVKNNDLLCNTLATDLATQANSTYTSISGNSGACL